MSLSVSGNMVLIGNVGRNDQGTYFLVSTNPAGSAKVTFAIEVECEWYLSFLMLRGHCTRLSGMAHRSTMYILYIQHC